MRKSNKKLKGFTLIELIVVVAIFAMIMFGALAILRPVATQFTNTTKFENVRANVDNIRRYIEGNLRYADRVWVYTGYSSFDENNVKDFSDEYCLGNSYYGKTFSGGTEYINRHPIDPSLDNLKIYVMKINNSSTTNKGQISLSAYDCNGAKIASEDKPFAVNKAYYEKYGFIVDMGEILYKQDASGNILKDAMGNPIPDLDKGGKLQFTKYRASNFSFTIQVKSKSTDAGGNVSYQDSNITSTANFALTNAYNSYKGEYSVDKMFAKVSPIANPTGSTTLKDNFAVKNGSSNLLTNYDYECSRDRYKAISNPSVTQITGKDIYIIFTLPKDITP